MTWSHRDSSPLLRTAVRMVTHNGWLKLMSLVFSIFLFLIVRTQQVREYTRVAKVRIITAENVVVIGSQERALDVTVRLPSSIFSRQPGDSELIGELDVSHERVGKLRVRLSRDNFPNLDKRYALIIHDPWLEIELDTIIQKRVTVRAVLQGLPRDGISIERVIVEPEEVEVTGARREVAKVTRLSTSPINIENIDKNFSSLTKLVLEDFSSLRVTPDKVNVQVIVGPKQEVRVFRAVPVELVGRLHGTLRPSHVDVEIQGQNEVLESLKPADVRAYLDVTGLVPGWQERKVRLKIPLNTSLVRVVPETLSVYGQE